MVADGRSTSQGRACCCRLSRCGGCGRNEWNAAIIRAAAEGEEGAMVNEEEATLSLRTTTKEGRVRVVCYGGI